MHDATANTGERDEEDSPMLRGIRSKCMTQLLLLGVIDGIQVQLYKQSVLLLFDFQKRNISLFCLTI